MIEKMKAMSVEELQSTLDQLELLDSIQAAEYLGLSPATMRNPKSPYKKISLRLGQYLFWRKGDLTVVDTIQFSYIGDYNENGPIVNTGEITIERYGKSGWSWRDGLHDMRTNEEGDGVWMNGNQVQGTTQYSLPSDPKRALLKLARERARFNTFTGEIEKFRHEFTSAHDAAMKREENEHKRQD